MVSPLEQRRDAILRRLPQDGKMAEVGVLLGRLSEAVMIARPDASVVMVDNWLPGELQPEAYRKTRDEHSMASRDRASAHRREAMERAARFNAEVVEMNSVDAATRFPDGHFDLVFIDADHSEAGVRADIQAWSPKVKAGGWLGGHDYGNPEPKYDFSGVKRAVDAAFALVETDANFTWWVRL